MAKIGVIVEDKQLEDAIFDLQQQSGNIRPVMGVIGRKVGTRIRLGFSSGRSPDGQTWKPLRTRVGQPLRDTGRLQSSITQNVGDDYVDVGTNLKYAPVHQFGATIVPKKASRLVFPIKATGGVAFAKSVTIPKRPFMPLDNSGQIDLPAPWQQDVVLALRRHLLKQKQA